MLKGEGCDDSGIVTVVTMSLLPRYTVPIFHVFFVCCYSTFDDRYTRGDDRDGRAHFSCSGTRVQSRAHYLPILS
jgi:hypothetical protein